LAFPIIAGAGTMTTLVALRAEFQSINIVLAVMLNVIIVYVVLRLTKKIENLLGPGGIAILKKVFGIILLAIAVKLFTTNIASIVSDMFSTPK
jgi:multiple antibiotic resistance protein